MCSESTILAAERDDFPPWFIYRHRTLARDGPGYEHIASRLENPHLQTKDQLFEAILDKLILDKELYRNAYTDFFSGAMTRKDFEHTAA